MGCRDLSPSGDALIDEIAVEEATFCEDMAPIDM
jgi:hypothetical protein